VSYTGLAVIGVLGALVLDLGVLRTGLVRRRAFWTAYAIVFFFQLLTNGWLTGRDIVVYSGHHNLGARLVYAPVEDLLFGFSMVLQTQAWWVWWGRRLTPVDVASAASRGAPAKP
jgi:lycopene cyclase domain-containing protein